MMSLRKNYTALLLVSATTVCHVDSFLPQHTSLVRRTLTYSLRSAVTREEVEPARPPEDQSFSPLGALKQFLEAPGAPEGWNRYESLGGETGGIWRTKAMGLLPTTVVAAPIGMKWMAEQEGCGNIIAEQPQSTVDLLGPKSVSNLGGQRTAHAAVHRIFSEALSPKAMAQLRPLVEGALGTCAARFDERAASGEEVVMFDEISRFTLEVISHSFLGDYVTHEVLEDIVRIIPTHSQGMLSLPRRFPWPLNTFPMFSFGAAMDAREVFLEMVKRIVEQRRADLISQESGSGKRSAGVLDTLLAVQRDQVASGGPGEGELLLDDDFILDNVMTAFFAGYDTTSVSLTRTLELLKEPNGETVVEELLDEIGGTTTTNDGNLETSLDDVETKASAGGNRARGIFGGFPLLDAVVLETFRVYPVVAGVFRRAINSMSYNGYHIPAGESMSLNFGDAFEAESIYPEPQRFCPFRFVHGDKERDTSDPVTSTEQSRPTMWGFGTHMCPGRELAKLEILLFMKMFLSKFDYDLVEGQNFKGIMPLNAPKDKLRVVLKPKAIS